MKVLEKSELHAISKVSAILRSISLPLLFHTVHLHARDGPGLQHLADAYIQEQALCKNITKLRLDYRQAITKAGVSAWGTFKISQADAAFFSGIDGSPMSCLTTLVLHKVALVDLWVHSIFESQTLRRLQVHACLCNTLTKPFPSTQISELVIEELQYSDNQEFDALVTFLAPKLKVLEIHGRLSFTETSLPTVFPTTCPRLRRYVLRVHRARYHFFVRCLTEFLVRTTTIEDLDLGVIFPSDPMTLPPSALPNLRLYDVALSEGFPATKYITGPRKGLGILRIRDDFLLHNFDNVQNFLDVPYEVSELHLTFRQPKIAKLLPLQVDQGLPNIERLYLNIRANHLCLSPQDDPSLCQYCTVLDYNLIGVSEFVNRVKARYPIQEDDGDCSRSTCLHKLEKIDVEIDVDRIGTTTPHTLDEWFHCTVEANCPALKEVYLRVWKANDQGTRGDRAGLGLRLWARWHREIDEQWRYKWGF